MPLLAACSGSEEGGPRGDLTFAVMGDAPYYWWEEQRYDHLIEALNRDSLDWVIHVGDLFWKPCSAEKMRERLAVLQRLRHPLIYTPGDNEWTDCWGSREGGYAPLERLDTLRAIYFSDPGRTLGATPMRVDVQSDEPEWSEFVEHQRWSARGVVFATLHVVGSWNARIGFPGRTAADDEASVRRTAAVVAWLREAFAEARATEARALFLICHAFPDPATSSEEHRRAYEPFLEVLEEEVEAFEGQVVLAHGDDHQFIVDRPLVDGRTGSTLENLTRLEVMGSPEVGWVRVVVDSAGPRFDFEPRRISGWKIW